MEGENIYQSLSIHSLLHTHWSIIHINTILPNYPFISYYYILIRCRHSFTPLLTQTHEIESRKYITRRMTTDVYFLEDACAEIKSCMYRKITCTCCTGISNSCTWIFTVYRSIPWALPAVSCNSSGLHRNRCFVFIRGLH